MQPSQFITNQEPHRPLLAKDDGTFDLRQTVRPYEGQAGDHGSGPPLQRGVQRIGFDLSTSLRIYHCFVRPIAEYCLADKHQVGHQPPDDWDVWQSAPGRDAAGDARLRGGAADARQAGQSHDQLRSPGAPGKGPADVMLCLLGGKPVYEAEGCGAHPAAGARAPQAERYAGPGSGEMPEDRITLLHVLEQGPMD